MNDWFVTINRSMKNKVNFTDDTNLVANGIDDVLIKKRDGRYSLIKDVFYIPGIRCNLLIIGQFLEKGYKIHIENKALHVMNANGVLILKASMVSNRTFKVELKLIEHTYLATTASREEWIWLYRLEHLNFRDLNTLQKNEIVRGLPLINIPAENFEEFFKKFKSMVEWKRGHKIKVIKMDGGDEYVSNEFERFYDQECILHEVVSPYTPQQKGVAERKNRLIMNIMRRMLKGKNFSKKLWGEAVSM
ncbi:uncharacterized protein LOC127136560 [Lathyrus oleraceus]|uniref:uncharacterized protein LOC127136560 n=1 Tax=Pisum sativum TaxID=3888 RepID=UPI0021D151AD|nr:uncharacterized protein LOC127136560 [Pisum sativum]